MRVVSLLVAAAGLVAGKLVFTTDIETGSVIHGVSCEYLCMTEPVMKPNMNCWYKTWKWGFWTKKCVCTCSYDDWVGEGIPQAEGSPVKPYTRADGRCGDYRLADYPFQSALCKPSTCCSPSGECGTSSAHCECDDGCINHSFTNKNCVLEGLMKKPIDACTAGTKIDTVVSTIEAEQILNIVDAIAGNIPFFDTFWDIVNGIWSTTSGNPTNHLESTTKAVEDAVNEEIAKMKDCIDSRVSGAIIAKYKSDFATINRRFDNCRGDEGRTKYTCLQGLFHLFVGGLANFVGYEESLERLNHLEPAVAYLELLPSYQVILVTYLATLGGYMQAMQGEIDKASGTSRNQLECSYNNLVNQGRKDMIVLYDWVRDAEDAIAEYYTPSTTFTSGCNAVDQWKGRYNRTFTCGSELMAKQLRWVDHNCETSLGGGNECSYDDHCTYSKEMQTIWADLKMTDDHSCSFQLHGDWLCTNGGTTDADETGPKIIAAAKRFTDDVRDRIKYEWRPQFQRKYSKTVHSFMETYWENYPFKSSCSKTVGVPKPDLITNWLLNADGSNAVENGPHTYKERQRVEAQWKSGTSTWYPGFIDRVNKDGTYAVQYDDGDYWDVVPEVKIKLEGGRRSFVAIGNEIGTHNSLSVIPSVALPVAALASLLVAALAVFSFREKANKEDYAELGDREPLAA